METKGSARGHLPQSTLPSYNLHTHMSKKYPAESGLPCCNVSLGQNAQKSKYLRSIKYYNWELLVLLFKYLENNGAGWCHPSMKLSSSTPGCQEAGSGCSSEYCPGKEQVCSFIFLWSSQKAMPSTEAKVNVPSHIHQFRGTDGTSTASLSSFWKKEVSLVVFQRSGLAQSWDWA